MFSLWSTELSALIGPLDPVLCLRVTVECQWCLFAHLCLHETIGLDNFTTIKICCESFLSTDGVQGQIDAKVLVAGHSTTCSQKIHNQLVLLSILTLQISQRSRVVLSI